MPDDPQKACCQQQASRAKDQENKDSIAARKPPQCVEKPGHEGKRTGQHHPCSQCCRLGGCRFSPFKHASSSELPTKPAEIPGAARPGNRRYPQAAERCGSDCGDREGRRQHDTEEHGDHERDPVPWQEKTLTQLSSPCDCHLVDVHSLWVSFHWFYPGHAEGRGSVPAFQGRMDDGVPWRLSSALRGRHRGLLEGPSARARPFPPWEGVAVSMNAQLSDLSPALLA